PPRRTSLPCRSESCPDPPPSAALRFPERDDSAPRPFAKFPALAQERFRPRAGSRVVSWWQRKNEGGEQARPFVRVHILEVSYCRRGVFMKWLRSADLTVTSNLSPSRSKVSGTSTPAAPRPQIVR